MEHTHTMFPLDFESYIQESGRGCRDGLSGASVLFFAASLLTKSLDDFKSKGSPGDRSLDIRMLRYLLVQPPYYNTKSNSVPPVPTSCRRVCIVETFEEAPFCSLIAQLKSTPPEECCDLCKAGLNKQFAISKFQYVAFFSMRLN